MYIVKLGKQEVITDNVFEVIEKFIEVLELSEADPDLYITVARKPSAVQLIFGGEKDA